MDNQLHDLFGFAHDVDDMIEYDNTKEMPMFVKPEDMDSFLIGVKTLIDCINDM